MVDTPLRPYGGTTAAVPLGLVRSRPACSLGLAGTSPYLPSPASTNPAARSASRAARRSPSEATGIGARTGPPAQPSRSVEWNLLRHTAEEVVEHYRIDDEGGELVLPMRYLLAQSRPIP